MNSGTLWVFGYGSLIWEPGFGYSERAIARLAGWHRSFCMRSIHHRGTEENPGLVLALDAADGAHCDGVVFAVPDDNAVQTLAYLRERELISSAYLEKVLPVTLADGRRVDAVTYVIDPDHVQYCGGLALEEQARIIAGASGGRGPNRDYLWNTAAHLAELGLADPDLDWLSDRVGALLAGGAA
ncbi:gamma-glutamylcyclotransferase [Albidovulum sp.]|uniref:gamma-glutamylcyclotransferase n=1 Tax=Albidovulum sp. TaxID=1872424 RepID=UPI001D6BDC05|nr:gamma-glutamylcyclotransferase [Paracoccaceae bacterium]MCC0047437.1 gamma-glutamylcyclotransferase [Defluviimonas sp.]HPE25341.1 gamma-glutamylcyclotransferase [Albidovulum sp.]MCB2120747.1 gamma-glutamylcyclotransferase [Paracoccaceae bacterium]MCB2121914.1 gamma-glutamylcyclotransferase [Paracoccaceae bacterium]